MKKLIVTVVGLALLAPVSVSAQDVLTGDTRLACEAILCLSSGSRPSECSPSLNRYFGIKKRKLSDTLKARLDFLHFCPVSSQTPEMRALVSAISRGAGRCDVASLNQELRYTTTNSCGQEVTVIGNKMPDYCSIYTSHEYTYFDDVVPRYVGTPQTGGFWVEAKDYDAALAKYQQSQPKYPWMYNQCNY